MYVITQRSLIVCTYVLQLASCGCIMCMLHRWLYVYIIHATVVAVITGRIVVALLLLSLLVLCMLILY